MTKRNEAPAAGRGFVGGGGLIPVSTDVPAGSVAGRVSKVAAMGLLPLMLAGLGLWWITPGALAETELVGPRGPGCVRLVIAADVSGSMSALSAPRDEAVTQLLAWAPENLRPDDEVALVSFAATASVDIPPTRIDESAIRGGQPLNGGSTELAPLIAAVDGLAPTRCRTALLLMGDGQFSDLPGDEATATRQLADARVDTIDFLVPGRTEVPRHWEQLYPSAPPRVFDGTDPDETALTFGRRLAHLTQQTLQRTTTKEDDR